MNADAILNRHIELTDTAALAEFNEKRRQDKMKKTAGKSKVKS